MNIRLENDGEGGSHDNNESFRGFGSKRLHSTSDLDSDDEFV